MFLETSVRLVLRTQRKNGDHPINGAVEKVGGVLNSRISCIFESAAKWLGSASRMG